MSKSLSPSTPLGEGEPTGTTDNMLQSLLVGDRLLRVPRHSGDCCEHRVTCTIRWNPEWQALGLQADDGEWVSGMGIAGGFTRERK